MACVIDLKHGDCLQLMQEIPSNSIDMILCDLPYGTTKNKWDSVIPFDALWEQYNRILKDNGVCALFCDGIFMVDLICSNKKAWKYNLIWDKQKGCDFMNANLKPLKSHENISIFYRSRPVYNPQKWFSKPYKLTKSKTNTTCYGKINVSYHESLDGSRMPLSVLRFKYDGKRYHPTQKPVALCEWLIKTYTNEGGTVLDNCMGSGSTGVACVNTGRNFIGMELDEKYYKIAENRIAEAYRLWSS